MVFFTCNDCGQSIKKNQVEKHCSYRCRNFNLSCMDCGKDFQGNDYKMHIKCITEDEKYGGKGYTPKASSNKNEIKQEKWIQHIKEKLETKNMSPPVRNLLQKIISYPNIPRKKAKFEKFVLNCVGVRNLNHIAAAWDIFDQSQFSQNSKENPDSTNGKNLNDGGTVNGKSSTGTTSLPQKRTSEVLLTEPAKKVCSETILNGKNGDSTFSNFNWTAACEEILENHPSGLPEKKLRKQIIKKYISTFGSNDLYSEADLKTLLRSKVLHCPIFNVSVKPSDT